MFKITNREDQLRRAILGIVRGVEVSFLPVPPEDAPHRVHSRAVLDALLWRRKIRSDESDSHIPFTDRCDTDLVAKIILIWALLQAPWNSVLTHYCVGPGCVCGGSLETLVNKLYELFCWVIIDSLPLTPCVSRWDTLGPVVAWFALGILLHNMLPTAWCLAFAKEKTRLPRKT